MSAFITRIRMCNERWRCSICKVRACLVNKSSVYVSSPQRPLITILRSTARAGWHNAKRSPSRRDSMHGTSIAGCLEASLAGAPARNRRRSPREGHRPNRHHAPTDAGAAVSAHALCRGAGGGSRLGHCVACRPLHPIST
jgi:hypothetical protein